MEKRTLIISASPRRNGNSQALASQFEKGAKQAGHDVKTIFLADKHIGYCQGCGACGHTSRCFQQDDMADILQDMIDADVLVFASPVYFYSIDAQLKTLIDRTVPRYTEIKDKDVYVLLTAADEDKNMLERSVETLRGFYEDCLDNVKEAGIVYGTNAWKIGEIQHTPAYEEAYELGQNI